MLPLPRAQLEFQRRLARTYQWELGPEEQVGAKLQATIEVGVGLFTGYLALRGIDEVGGVGLRLSRNSRRGADELDCPGGRCAGRRVPCFVEDTEVRLCDGETRDIEEIAAGDQVLARNAETGEMVCRTVEKRIKTPNARILDLRIRSSDGTPQTFGVTGDHPFWTRKGGWTNASDLKSGDRVSTASGGWRRILGSDWHAERRTVYNLEVAQAHTYFVGDPAVWVHNTCQRKPLDIQEEMALKEAKSGKGEVIMKPGEIGDPRYSGTHVKMQHIHKHPDGSKTVIHYWKELDTGELSGFKFKAQPGTRRFRHYGVTPEE